MRLAPIAAVVCALEVCALAAPTPEALYAEGQSAYDVADYATAIKKWRGAYKLSGAPGLLLNLGQAYRLSGDCVHALASYKEFVATGPTVVDDRKLARDWIDKLKPKCGELKVDAAEERPVEDPGRTKKVAGLAIGGAGLVSIAVGIGFGVHASKLSDDAMRMCTVASPCAPSVANAPDRYRTLGWAFGAAGALALVGGATLYYFGTRDSAVQVAPLAARPHETGAVLTWRATW